MRATVSTKKTIKVLEGTDLSFFKNTGYVATTDEGLEDQDNE